MFHVTRVTHRERRESEEGLEKGVVFIYSVETKAATFSGKDHRT